VAVQIGIRRAGWLALILLVIAAVFAAARLRYALDRDLDAVMDRAQVAADAADMLRLMATLREHLNAYDATTGYGAYVLKSPRNNLALQYRTVEGIITRLEQLNGVAKNDAKYDAALTDLRGLLQQMPRSAGMIFWRKGPLLACRAVGACGKNSPVDVAVKAVPPDQSERAEWEAGLGELSAIDPTAFANLLKHITLIAELAMARLGFNPGPLDGVADPQTQDAIRRYEQARRLEVTGDPLSFATMKQVITDEAVLNHRPVLLPSSRFDDAAWTSGSVSLLGTWRRRDQPGTSAPEEATSIVCERQTQVCRATTALLTDVENGSHVLSLSTQTYEIDRWGDGEISTKSDVDHLRLRIVRATKAVTEDDLENGASTVRRELTNGYDECVRRFAEGERARIALLAVNAETREWLVRQAEPPH
jgi:peptidoglycan hydrolase-like protein with peptidoglycan-binding domain